MADFAIFPIDRTWRTAGLPNKFVVDILEDNGVVRRGYVCDNSESGLLVKVGSGRRTTLLVPFHRLKLPNDDTCSSTMPEDIEVLVDLNTDFEIWQRAKLISSCKCACSTLYGSCTWTYTLLYVHLQDCQPPTANTRSIFVKGHTEITQRVRRRGQPSSQITPDTFCKLILPMPHPTPQCPDPAASLRQAFGLPRFSQYWLSYTCTLFVAVTDEHIEVLRVEDSELTSALESPEQLIVTEVIQCLLPGFLERFDMLCSEAVLDTINDMISAVVHLKDASDANDPYFQDLPVIIHLSVLSYLDVYDQNLLKRVSKCFIQHLGTFSVQRCAIITANATYDVGSLDCTTYWLEKNSFTLTHVILRSATRNLRVLYLTGNWINCLLPLTCLLDFMSVKLDWLVISQNAALQINEFQSFPQPRVIWSDPLPVPSYWNICRNLALKNVVFSSYYSVCFRDCQISPSSFSCCYSPFLIPVSRWSVNLVDSSSSAEDKWTVSVRSMFYSFCPKLTDEEITTLMDWLNRTEMVENLALWACICRCFSLWGVKPPGDVSGIRCVVIYGMTAFENPPKKDPNALQCLRCALSGKFPQRNIIMRTLALLIPHIDCGQPLPEHILRGF